jgi:hypothetical protein
LFAHKYPIKLINKFLDAYFNSGSIRTLVKYQLNFIAKDMNPLGFNAHLRIQEGYFHNGNNLLFLEKGFVRKSTKILYQLISLEDAYTCIELEERKRDSI